ncbi:MAG TPA: hypothetical protein VMQ65_08835 [Candidatus Limnocylindria bacterium]|nr:hypothetical protein [Candidatus Limnocylindria bacterium]
MSLVLVAVVLAIGAGAVTAVSTREAAAAAIGLAVALVASSLLVDPLPSAAILGVRVVAALLAAALIRWAAHGGPRQYSPLGWPGEAMLATAAAVAGLGLAIGLASVTPLGGPPVGAPGGPGVGNPDASVVTTMALTIAAAATLLALGAAPVMHGSPGVRRAIGLVLVTQAVLLLRIGLAGPATELEEIARAALLVAVAASGSALTRATAAADSGARAEADASAVAERATGPGRPGTRRPVTTR